MLTFLSESKKEPKMKIKQILEEIDPGLELRLLAGEGGLAHPVTSVHSIDNILSSAFIDQGELVIIVSNSISQQNALLEIIQASYKAKASGILYNLDEEGTLPSKDCLDFCNAHDFPLFVFPWRQSVGRVNFQIVEAIIRHNRNHASKKYWEKVLGGENIDEGIYGYPHGLSEVRRVQVGRIQIRKTDQWQKSLIQLENFVASVPKNRIYFFDKEDENVLIFVFLDTSPDKVYKFMDECLSFCRSRHIQVNIALSSGRNGISSLQKAYKEALYAQIMEADSKEKWSMIQGQELEFFNLLFEIQRDQKEDYVRKILNSIQEYDRIKGTDLFAFLVSWLNHNCNAQDTAAAQYVHVNTVNYRLKKISDLLDGKELDIHKIVQLYIAVAMRILLKEEDPDPDLGKAKV